MNERPRMEVVECASVGEENGRQKGLGGSRQEERRTIVAVSGSGEKLLEVLPVLVVSGVEVLDVCERGSGGG